MQIHRIAVQDFRRFASAEFEPDAGINLITGDNGEGKTSIIEAAHLMAHGRSFRGRVRDGLVRQQCEALEVFVEWEEHGGAVGRRRRAGLRHSGQVWKGRLDGADVQQMGDLCAALAVITFDPGSHALISGSGDTRRRFLDWGLFHVEQDFLVLWRRYSRALKQRNALLKQGASAQALDAWDHELAESGEVLTQRRQGYLERLEEQLVPLAHELAPSLAIESLIFSPGWKRHELSLADALLLARERDRQYGYTSLGPHRADWAPAYGRISGRDMLSRGQAKLTALACLIAQASDYFQTKAEWPVVALDDLPSELDRNHQQRVLKFLAATPAQVLVTATEFASSVQSAGVNLTLFHVEQGRVERRG